MRYDVASAMALGRRKTQEDALVTDFPIGVQSGFAVLSDGMGGHAAGEVASRIAVTQVYSDLKKRDGSVRGSAVPDMLRAALSTANGSIESHVRSFPETRGMGATLVALVFSRDRLNWISVGDSPVFLVRQGRLRQLNEDHSLAPQIDFLVEIGQLDPEEGQQHPDRHCLTSVLMGDAIERVDCPQRPFRMLPDDVLIVASDGLQVLSNESISAIVRRHPTGTARAIAQALLDAVEALAEPEQDNVAFAVIRPEFGTPVVALPAPERKADRSWATGGWRLASALVRAIGRVRTMESRQ